MTEGKKLRLVELFSGIGAQASALDRAGIAYESCGTAEILPIAITAYRAIHGESPELGDITKLKRLPECDLLTYSYPCTSVSMAGKRAGMAEGSGTASSLVWEVGRLLRTAASEGKLPETLLMENVPAVTYKANVGEFRRWIALLTELGYTSEYAILNATEFGIPQNRKRCYMVSRLGGKGFTFPKPTVLSRHLSDLLEPSVNEKYFISEERMKKLILHKQRNDALGNGFGYKLTDVKGVAKAITAGVRDNNQTLIQVAHFADEGRLESASRVYSPDGVSPTVCANSGGGLMPMIATVRSASEYDQIKSGDQVFIGNPPDDRQCVAIGNSDCPAGVKATIPVPNGVYDGLRIRRLTPRECWRLMGFSDAQFDLASHAMIGNRALSDSALYKLAGNSIVVDVLASIFRNLYSEQMPVRQVTLEEWA